MEQLNAQLHQLQERIAYLTNIQSKIDDLVEQQRAQRATVQRLKERTYKEQLDVDKLESFSAQKLFYLITGQLSEKLETEQAELYAAALRYDAARKELEALEADLASYREDLEELRSCRRKYHQLLQDKAQRMKELNGIYLEKLLALEDRIAALKSRDKELREAISAAENALHDVESIQQSLTSAKNWSTMDMFGGGLISDLAKHSHLDSAQQQIYSLQRSLSRLRTELADVAVHADLQIQVDGFLRFADYFFDGLFADWAVHDRIQSAQSQVWDVENSIRHIRAQLEVRLDQCAAELSAAQDELKTLIMNA